MGYIYTGLSLLCIFCWMSFGQDSDCPPTTFSCGNGCIPKEWVCDKVKDCKNGQDEDETYCNSLSSSASTVTETETESLQHSSAATTEPTAAVTTSYYMTSSSTVDYSDNAATSTEQTTTTETFDINESELTGIPICSAEKRAIVESCYQKIGEWVEIFGSIELNVGLFSSSEQMQKIENSCNIYEQFRECLGDIYQNPSGCILPEALDSWDRFEAYTCQLLLPAASDHTECFTKINNHSCSIDHYNIQSSSLMANFCYPIFSVKRVLDCAPRVQDSCSRDSRDVINAISTETSVSDSLYACSDSISSSADSFSTTCPNNREVQPCFEILNQTNVRYLSSFIGNSVSEIESACKAYILHRECLNEKFGNNQECWPTDDQFLYMDTVFSTYCSSDILQMASEHSSCLRSSKSDAQVEQCRLEKMREGPNTCESLGNLLGFLICSQTVVKDLCGNSGEELVKMLHGRLSDQLISLDCDGFSFGEKDEEINMLSKEELSGSAADHFTLAPSFYPKCSNDDETGALACLLGLFELQQMFGDFGRQNIFVELANKNSTLIAQTCTIYDSYEECLQSSIFRVRGGRCSFSANINKMARIGLAPLCNRTTREKVQKYRSCIIALQQNGELTQCSMRLNELGHLVVDLIQGGTDYTLCKVFYLVRELFACIEPKISATCGSEPLEATKEVKQLITDYGVEEGCPAIKPHNFDSFPSLPRSTTEEEYYEYDDDYGSSTRKPLESSCEIEGYSQFNFCLRPLGQFKPNALSVISDPRQISNACSAYRNFHDCRESISCKPDWSAGVDRMFDYACNSGLALYNSVKRCLKRISLRKDMKACVEHFTKNANSGDSCAVSNQFLFCSSVTVMEKCGERALEFIESFIIRFALGTDPTCNMELLSDSTELKVENEKFVVGIGCTKSELEKLKFCEEVMYPTMNKIRNLFKGGIGAFISNTNLLGEIFAEGCENSAIFQECVKSTIRDSSSSSSCTVGSCLIQAGQGICDSPDRANLISKHLNCVFRLISEPEFGKCIRASFSGASLANLDLEGLKKLVPEFVNCASGIIERKCGLVPLNIMKSVGAKPEQCLISLDETTSSTEAVSSTSGSMDQDQSSTMSTDASNSTAWEETSSTAEPIAEPELAPTTTHSYYTSSTTDIMSEMSSTTEPTAVTTTYETEMTTTYETETSTQMDQSSSTSEYAEPEATAADTTEITTIITTNNIPSSTTSETETSRAVTTQDGAHTTTMIEGSTASTDISGYAEPESAAESTTDYDSSTTSSSAEPVSESTELQVEPETTSFAEPDATSTTIYTHSDSTSTQYFDYYSETTNTVETSEAEPEVTTEPLSETEATTESTSTTETETTTTTPLVKTTPMKKQKTDSRSHPKTAFATVNKGGRLLFCPHRTNLFFVTILLFWITGFCFLRQVIW